MQIWVLHIHRRGCTEIFHKYILASFMRHSKDDISSLLRDHDCWNLEFTVQKLLIGRISFIMRIKKHGCVKIDNLNAELNHLSCYYNKNNRWKYKHT